MYLFSTNKFDLATRTEESAKKKATIEQYTKKADFHGFNVVKKNLKAGSKGFDCQNCLEASLPALALFLHRDPFTFASMGLQSNHRLVNTTNFEQTKGDKPPIVEAIEIQGDTSFQTSQVDISFYRIDVRNKKDDTQPCLQSLSRFDFENVDNTGATGKLLFVFAVSVLTFRSLTISFCTRTHPLKRFAVGPCSLTLL